MYSNLFSPDSIAELTVAMQTQFPKAIWETFYVTLLSTALAVVIGLPLGVLLTLIGALLYCIFVMHSWGSAAKVVVIGVLTVLANSITLTPGTITMDIDERQGRTWYYIHWIDVQETDREAAGDAIKGRMEKWVRRIWQ